MKTYKQDASEIMARGRAAYRKKKNARRAILGLAAVLLIAAVLGVWRLTSPDKIGVNEPEPGSSAAESDTLPPAQTQTADPGSAVLPGETAPAETGYVLPWQEAPCYMQYPELRFEGRVYRTTGVPIDPAPVAEGLGEAELSGYDNYAEEAHTGSVSASRIGNIKPECAVAAVLADGNTYAYVNADYTPETLGQLIADLDLKNTARFGEAYLTERKSDGGAVFVRFDDCDDALLWNGLLADESLVNKPDAPFGPQTLSFRFDLPALGYENKGLWLTGDGYLVTNILETGKAFYIGADAANAFLARMRQTVPFESRENVTFGPGEGAREENYSLPMEP